MQILSIFIFLPLIWGIFTSFSSFLSDRQLKYSHLAIYLIQLFFICIQAFTGYSENSVFVPIEENLKWIQMSLSDLNPKNPVWLEARYHLRLDGLNILMVLLNCILFPISVMASREIRNRSYYFLLSLLNTSILGCFLAQDFLLFYLFYEFMLIPMFFLIGMWGGEKRQFSATKFILYTLLGSVFMLLVMVGLVFSYQFVDSFGIHHTFSFEKLSDPKNIIPSSIFSHDSGSYYRIFGFWFLFIAFAIKLPMVPLHTWLPDAHVEASTPISVLLAGILLKVGGYGLFKVAFSIFPDVAMQFTNEISILAAITIIYGALNALGQKDLKRMIAYSSVAHMGFVLLASVTFNTTGINGAFLQMFNHGIISAMLFLGAGVLYDRVHNYGIDNFRGLWSAMPKYTFFILIAFFAGLGMPGFSAFVSEMLIFAGAFQSTWLKTSIVFVSIFGIFLSACYFLWTIKRMFMGNFEVMGGDPWKEKLKDLSRGETIIFSFLGILTFIGGIYPQPFISIMDHSISNFLALLIKSATNK